LLGLLAQLLSQRRNFLRQSGPLPRFRLRPYCACPSVRSGILFQAGFPSSYRIVLSVRPLRSTGITPLPRYYGPLRLPTGPPRRLCLPTARWLLSPPPGRASQAPRLICPRALSPTTPEGPLAACACCFTTGLSGFILVGGLATFVFLSRPNRVHLRYGSRVCLPSRSGSIAGTPARSATC